MMDKYERLSRARTARAMAQATNVFGRTEKELFEIEKMSALADKEFNEAYNAVYNSEEQA